MGVDDFHVSASYMDGLVKEGLLQAVLELAVAYEEKAITSERFAEKVCGLRNIYYKEVGDRYETRV